MEIREAHILFDSLFQRVDTNFKGSVPPEFKDLYINLATKAEINEIRKRYEDGQGNLDRLEVLKESASLTPYVDNDDSYYRVSSIIPSNYHFLVTDRSYLTYNCNGQTFTQINYDSQYAWVNFVEDTTHAGGLYYTGFKVEVTTNTGTAAIFNVASLPTGYFASGYKTLKEEVARFYIINLLTDYIRNVNNSFTITGVSFNLDVYWERYGDTFNKNNFCFVFSNVSGGTITSVTVTSETSSPTFASGSAASPLTKKYNNSVFTGTSYDRENRLTSSEILYNKLAHPFKKTSFESPISIMENNIIKVYHDDTFGVRNINITYIRKPRLVNYYLKINIELPNVEEIIMRAVKLVDASVINNDVQGYQAIAQELITFK